MDSEGKQSAPKPTDPRPNDDQLSRFNRVHRWDTYIDERIRQWIGDGDMSAHPKAGQALDLNGDANTPKDMRMAYKLMKENDAVPEWIDLGSSLRERRQKLRTRLLHYARDYIARESHALQIGSYVIANQVEKRWKEALTGLRPDVDKFNSEILNYNLKIPASIEQMLPFNLNEETDTALHLAKMSS